jgi:hypothetical protein
LIVDLIPKELRREEGVCISSKVIRRHEKEEKKKRERLEKILHEDHSVFFDILI